MTYIHPDDRDPPLARALAATAPQGHRSNSNTALIDSKAEGK